MDVRRSLTQSDRRMLRTTSIHLLALMIFLLCGPNPLCAAQDPQWTIMIYANGKNSLEQDALNNFHSMAKIGSTKDVNVVVELGRPQSPSGDDGGWAGVYRFLVKKGMDPIPDNAITRVAALGESEDMGQPATLLNFIAWAKKAYPAQRFMLIIWNHGQGWRFELAANKEVRYATSRAQVSKPLQAGTEANTPTLGGIKAISIDDDTGSILYNRDVEDVLASAFDPHKPLDVLGFDACLMSMIESAYAFSPSVNVMVASEETELTEGWQYAAWLERLTTQPQSSPEAVAGFIVSSYKARYGDEYLTTLSALHLRSTKAVATQFSEFSGHVLAAGRGELIALRKARSIWSSYGSSIRPPPRTSVDLVSVLRIYESLTSNQALREESKKVRTAIGALIFENYASTRSAKPPARTPAGSEGLAIYFPESRAAFDRDFYKSGYIKSSTSVSPAERSVAFVEDTKWPDLMFAVIDLPANASRQARH